MQKQLRNFFAGLFITGASVAVPFWGLQPVGATVAPTGVDSIYATFTNPGDGFAGLTVDPSGNLYTVDESTCQMIKIDATTKTSAVISTNSGWCGSIYNLTYAVVGGTPTLIIPTYGTGNGDGAISTMPAAGGAVTRVGTEGAPAGVAYDSSTDTLYIADFNGRGHYLWKMTNFSLCSNGNQCTAIEIPSTDGSDMMGLVLQGDTLYSLSWETTNLLAGIPTSGGAWVNSYDSVGTSNDSYGSPTADLAGNIYYPNIDNGKIYELPVGGFTSRALTITGGFLTQPDGGPVYYDGGLYVINYDTGLHHSSIVKITLPPVAPTSVTAIPSNGSATVGWTSSPGGTSYTVTSSPGGQTCSVTAPETSCVVSGLTNGTSYTFSVVATNSAGTSNPSEGSVPVTPTAPAPITPSTLAKTGSSLDETLLLGLGAIGLGTPLVASHRLRRRRARPHS